MTEADFLSWGQALAGQRLVRASPVLEGHHEIEIDDTLIALRWSDSGERIDLTIPLPKQDQGNEGDLPLEGLYRLLMQFQWAQGDEDGVGFGVLPESDEIVGMVSLDAPRIDSPDELLQLLADALADVQAAWFEVGAQWLIECTAALRLEPHQAGSTDTARTLLRA